MELKEDFAMPSPCTVCLHPNRAEVDQHLATQRVNIAALARTLGVGRKALERHRDHHVPAPLAAFTAAPASGSASPLLADLERIYQLTLEALASAERAALSHLAARRVEPAASHAAIAASVNDARRHLGTLAELFVGAAEAGHLSQPQDPQLEGRIQAALAGVAERARTLATTP
jgi:hypothetical protein